nr:DUF6582 domain-containing protein [uncultured Actinoplanes sp.]
MAGKTRHELDAADRNALPDSAFAFPRTRKEPLSDARHVRNALARFDQVEDVTDQERDEAFRRIRKAAEKFGVDVSETSWRELGKPGSSAENRSKAELYAEARRRGIDGRSSMTKAELLKALETR